MQKLMSLICLMLFATVSMYAQVAKGTLSYYTKDSVLVVKLTSGTAPAKNTPVNVVKLFKFGNMEGTHGLAEATILSVDGSKVKMQVTRYRSTMVENGVRRPMTKPGDQIRIEWGSGTKDKDKSSTTNTTHTDSGLDKIKRLYKERKDFEAIEEATKQIAKDSKCMDCYYLRGRIYQQNSRYEDAIADYTTAIETSAKGAANAYFYRAECYNWSYQPNKAIADFDHLLGVGLGTKDNIYIHKEKLKIYDKMIDARGYSDKEKLSIKKKACICLEELQKIDDPRDLYKRDWKNKYCSDILVTTSEKQQLNAVMLSQSEDTYTIKATLVKEEGTCKAFGRKNYTPDIKVGTAVNLKTCRDDKARAFAEAVVKVKSIEGTTMILEVMYWDKSYGGKASTKEYKVGDTFSLEW
ncbi:MAG: tetratricopeptide repeat protein [Aureispira sp.]|nr:tetratricopeptide repeat protein [Aureispira sp.]